MRMTSCAKRIEEWIWQEGFVQEQLNSQKESENHMYNTFCK